MFGFVGEKNEDTGKYILIPTLNTRKLSCFGVWTLWCVNGEWCINLVRGSDDGRQRRQEVKRAHTQKAHTRKQPRNSLIIWLNFADTLDQIPDRCLVLFCAKDCQHIFDCRFFSFTFIKSSIYNQDWHSYFIGKSQLYSEKSSQENIPQLTDSGGKASLFVEKNHNTFKELYWTISNWNWV